MNDKPFDPVLFPYESIEECRAILDKNPRHENAWAALGTAYLTLHRAKEAESAFVEAIRLNPNHERAQFNLSMVHILQGKYLQGFAGSEWRWKVSRLNSNPFPRCDMWDGRKVGKVCIWHEQGFGDSLQMLRFAPQVAERTGIKPMILIQRELESLVARMDCFDSIDIIPPRKPFACDYSAPMCSLPRMLRVDIRSIPPPANFGFKHHGNWPPKRIAINCSGNPHHKLAHARNMSIELLRPLQQLPFEFVASPIGKDFLQTAKMLLDIDLLITVDTAVSHLGACIGMPVWMMSYIGNDGRWGLNSTATPWYPTMRIFRQSAWLDWSNVVRDVKDALGKLI